MKNNTDLSSISAIGSITYRQLPEENQDYTRKVRNTALGVQAIIVADGLGSQEYSGLGARWASELAAEIIQSAASLTEIELQDMFMKIRRSIKNKAESFLIEQGVVVDRNQSFGTTLIIAIEDASSIMIGYVGNGAIWHIRGSFNDFSENLYFPWNALNYLNPHTVQNEFGKEALYRMISISDNDAETNPTILKINKDSLYGDILMICTDGIYSNDQVSVGRMQDSSIWCKTEPTISRFLAMLNDFFLSAKHVTDDYLFDSLNRYLSEALTAGLFDDDASIGLIISDAALKYQCNRKKHLKS